MSNVYPAFHQPSAFYSSYPMEEEPSSANAKDMPNLSDECPICLDDFRSTAAGDQRGYRVLAKTECNHFFHQFCLDEHLKHGMNTNCPICRQSALVYSTINLDPQPSQDVRTPPSQPKVTNSNAPQNTAKKEEIDLAEDLLNVGGAVLYGLGSLAYATAKLGGFALYNVANYGINAVASSLTETKQQLDQRAHSIYQKWAKTTSNLEAAMCRYKEDLSVLVATIKSLPESSIYKARVSTDRLEAALTAFEQSIIDNQNRFKLVLNEEKQQLSIR